MGNGSGQEDKELAEVTRVVDEIARQIRQEQEVSEQADNTDLESAEVDVASVVESVQEAEDNLETGSLFGDSDLQQFLDDVAPLEESEETAESAPENIQPAETPDQPAETPVPETISITEEPGSAEQNSSIGALLNLFKPGSADSGTVVDDAPDNTTNDMIVSDSTIPAAPAEPRPVVETTEPRAATERSTQTDYRTTPYMDIDHDVRDVLYLPLSQSSPLQCFTDFAEELPLQFPVHQFRIAVQGEAEDFADALAETRSSAANINMLLRYAEALQAEQHEKYSESVRILDELGRPALDNPPMRYDLARIAERAGDVARAREEYQTLIGISEDVEMQQLALARLIDLAHQSRDTQAVPALLRQLCSRLNTSDQQKVLPRFYPLAEQVRDPDDRRWILEKLLELAVFDEDPHLLMQSVTLARQRGDEDALLSLLIRLCDALEGAERIKPLQQLLAVYRQRDDDPAIDVTLRRLWHTAEEAEHAPVLLETLHQLHKRDSEDSDILLAMAACQRAVEDSKALIVTLQKLSLVTDSATTRQDTLSELIELYEAAGDLDSADEVVLRLLENRPDALERITTRAGGCSGARQKYWYGILYQWAEAAGDHAMMKRGAEALLRHAMTDSDEIAELENLARLKNYGEQPVDRWLRIAHLARKQDRRALLTEALDAVLASDERQKDLLEERINYHIEAEEYAAATGRFEALLAVSISMERLAVITKLLGMPENSLPPVRESELCYELIGLVQEQSPERFIALERLRLLEPENTAHLHLLIAHYRSTQNKKALGNALIALQALQAGSAQQIVTLNEAITHFDACDEPEAMDSAFETLLPLLNHPLERIVRHIETCSGPRRGRWFEQLRKYATTSGDIEHQLIGLAGLVECAENTEKEIEYLRAMLPLSTEQGDIWRQLLERYRNDEDEADYREARIEAIDQLIAHSSDTAEQASLLRERADIHIAAGETEDALEKLSQLSQVSDSPNSILQEILSRGRDKLSTEQRIDIQRELSRSGTSNERKKALIDLALMLVEDERLFDAIDVLMQHRMMEQKGSTEMAALNAQVEALIPQISVASGVVSHPKLMQQLKDEFGHIAEFTQQYYDYALTTAIEKKDGKRLEVIMQGALKQEATWQSCLRLTEKQLLQALGLLRKSSSVKAIFERFEQDAPSVRIRRFTTQFLAPIFEAEKNWGKAILYWKNAAKAALEEQDQLAAARIQLRLLALYRSLKMTEEAEAYADKIADLPETISNELGEYMIQPIELHGVARLRDGDTNMALAAFNRAIALRQNHQKMDHTAATLLGNLAELYLKLKNMDQAEQHFTLAIEHLNMHPEPTAAVRQKREAYRARKRIIDSHRELALLKAKK